MMFLSKRDVPSDSMYEGVNMIKLSVESSLITLKAGWPPVVRARERPGPATRPWVVLDGHSVESEPVSDSVSCGQRKFSLVSKVMSLQDLLGSKSIQSRDDDDDDDGDASMASPKSNGSGGSGESEEEEEDSDGQGGKGVDLMGDNTGDDDSSEEEDDDSEEERRVRKGECSRTYIV